MTNRLPHIAFGLLLALLLSSCAGYQRGMRQYNHLLAAGKYQQAYDALPSYSFLQNNRNQFLYYAERGRLAQYLNLHDTSTFYLNEADKLLEETWRNAGDAVKSNLINPMQERYLAADLERMMLHYSKALNFLTSGNTEGALVEARRITLQADRLKDGKYKGTNHALGFGYWVQGLIYETAGRSNDAFIAYRNAANLYIQPNSTGKLVANSNMPSGLVADVVRTAASLGFTDQVSRYEGFLVKEEEIQTAKSGNGGMLIVLHEVGTAPQLENSYFSFNSWAPGGNDIYFTDRHHQYNLPVQYASLNSMSSGLSPSWLKGLRVAMAVPVPTSNTQWNGVAAVNGNQYRFSQVQDLYLWSVRPERLSNELQKAVVRALIKKGAEIAIQEGSRAVASASQKKDDKGNNDKASEKAKDAAQAAAIAEGVGLLVNLLNQSTEKADTRSWRSLPGSIYAVRIPLQAGNNEITIQSGKKTSTLSIQGNGSTQVVKFSP